MAHTKSGGTTKLGRDSESKRLGIKLFDGQEAKPGAIIVRQRGLEILPGENVRMGKDYTLFAVKAGRVKFRERRKIRFDGKVRKIKEVSVI